MPRNEADTRAELIDTQLKLAGWTDRQVTREHYYHRDLAYTAGRIVLRGDRASHGHPRRLDYLLRYTDAFPIAVVEAKSYAREMDVAFAYATNGRGYSSTTSSPTRAAPKMPFYVGPDCRRSGSILTNVVPSRMSCTRSACTWRFWPRCWSSPRPTSSTCWPT